MIPDWAAERKRMVDKQLRGRGIADERVLAAMLEIPREEFVPLESRILSYADDPVPIGFGQTISQPYMTALMAQSLDLKGTETILDVGAGSGYGAAVLGILGARVISIELIQGLAQFATRNLKRTGRAGNVTVVVGDGSVGYAQSAPYDAISVGAAAPETPGKLIDQLRDSGRLVIPVGTRKDQWLMIITKEDGAAESRVVTQCRFVPLRGAEGWR
jgi:protein-L-isoaspartate(D-aspartate) O-methyltransferase